MCPSFLHPYQIGFSLLSLLGHSSFPKFLLFFPHSIELLGCKGEIFIRLWFILYDLIKLKSSERFKSFTLMWVFKSQILTFIISFVLLQDLFMNDEYTHQLFEFHNLQFRPFKDSFLCFPFSWKSPEYFVIYVILTNDRFQVFETIQNSLKLCYHRSYGLVLFRTKHFILSL